MLSEPALKASEQFAGQEYHFQVSPGFGEQSVAGEVH
jgi:hypothetical protein